MMKPERNRQRGKATEKAIAKRIGGKRVGIFGGEDIDAGPFSVEVKDRSVFVGGSFMAQAVRNCPQGKTPLVIVHVTGARHDGDLVIMRMRDWEEWFGDLTKGEGQDGSQDQH
jgi:hypothetical protein